MFWWFIIAGLFGGICGGMGMGGGTLLIPALTFVLGVEQHLAQALNLLVFIPTGIVALILHAKNKLLDYKVFFIIILPAIGAAVGMAFLVGRIKSELLRTLFAVFLILIGLFELGKAIRTTIQNKKKKPIIKSNSKMKLAKNLQKFRLYSTK